MNSSTFKEIQQPHFQPIATKITFNIMQCEVLNNAICNKRKQTYLDTYKMYVLHHILLNADVNCDRLLCPVILSVLMYIYSGKGPDM